MYSIIAIFLFSALGGTWFPLETSSGAFSSIGRLMPSAWAVNRIQNILIGGLGFSSVGLSALILLAVWRFRKAEL